MSAGCVEPRGTLRPVSLSTGAPFTRGFIVMATSSFEESWSSGTPGTRLPDVSGSGATARRFIGLPPTSAVPVIVTRPAVTAASGSDIQRDGQFGLVRGNDELGWDATIPAGRPAMASAIGPLKFPVRAAFTTTGVFEPSKAFSFCAGDR